MNRDYTCLPFFTFASFCDFAGEFMSRLTVKTTKSPPEIMLNKCSMASFLKTVTATCLWARHVVLIHSKRLQVVRGTAIMIAVPVRDASVVIWVHKIYKNPTALYILITFFKTQSTYKRNTITADKLGALTHWVSSGGLGKDLLTHLSV